MILLIAFWFFLPAGIANMGPVVASKLPRLSRWNTPMDFGRSYRGKRIFDNHKTWRGLLAGVVVAVAVVALQKYLYGRFGWIRDISWLNYASVNIWLLGALFGAGAILGDAAESFFKRQRGIAAGQGWFPFDQIDFIVGSLLATAPLTKPSFGLVVSVFFVYWGLHPLFVYIGYVLGFRTKADLKIF